MNNQQLKSFSSKDVTPFSYSTQSLKEKSNEENNNAINDEIMKEKIQSIVKPLNDIIENQKTIIAEMKQKMINMF
jgi:pantothenate kinase